MKKIPFVLAAASVAVLAMSACGAPPPSRLEQEAADRERAEVVSDAVETITAQQSYPQTGATPASTQETETAATVEPGTEANVRYTLVTGAGTNQLVFVGDGGEIDGITNPTLHANPGDTVEIRLVNGDAIQHNVAINELGVLSADISALNEEVVVTFTADEAGEYVYFCAVPGHYQAGMWGTLVVGSPVQEAAEGEDIIRNPTDVPALGTVPAGETLRFDLETVEVTGQLSDGTTYNYFTFGGKVPGPMLRMRVGDTAEVHITNDEGSSLPHSIDLHAVTGPGGGAVFTQTNPGDETMFTFQALNPGLYVYHCATPSVAHHIASGMYGLILVEPEGGLPPVDREFYVMQGEVYTAEAFGAQGHQSFSYEHMLSEDPEYLVFNGAAGALTLDEYALRANVGETVRIFFGVGGPNFTSSFHVIGEIFDRVYPFAALTSPPLTDVQTVTVPPGGAAMVEFTVDVPGRYILVDHALSRLERGLVGFLYVEGEEHPEIFDGEATEGSGH